MTGALPVPRDAWHKISAKLWMFRPFRKGHYQLLLGDQPVPEHPVPAGATALPEIPDDHWCAWKGAIYFQAASGLDDIPARPYEFAVGGVGLSLYAVRNVRVEDITFRHFRVDGVNAQDLARNVVLSNVQCLENGRAGVAISGTSEVIMTRCRAAGNRVNSVRVSEYGALQLKETDVDQPPEILDPPND